MTERREKAIRSMSLDIDADYRGEMARQCTFG
jgi:hypothetical protein